MQNKESLCNVRHIMCLPGTSTYCTRKAKLSLTKPSIYIKIYLNVIAIENTKTAKKLLEISDQKLLYKRILLSKNKT